MAAKDDTATVLQTVTFLRMAALEMRRIAKSGDDEIAQRLRHLADQNEREAEELAKQFGLPPLQ